MTDNKEDDELILDHLLAQMEQNNMAWTMDNFDKVLEQFQKEHVLKTPAQKQLQYLNKQIATFLMDK